MPWQPHNLRGFGIKTNEACMVNIRKYDEELGSKNQIRRYLANKVRPQNCKVQIDPFALITKVRRLVDGPRTNVTFNPPLTPVVQCTGVNKLDGSHARFRLRTTLSRPFGGQLAGISHA